LVLDLDLFRDYGLEFKDLALTLFMLWIITNHKQPSFPANNFAFGTSLFYGGSYLHRITIRDARNTGHEKPSWVVLRES